MSRIVIMKPFDAECDLKLPAIRLLSDMSDYQPGWRAPHVWVFDLDDPKWQAMADADAAGETALADRDLTHRRRHLGSLALLRRLTALHLGISADDVRFKYDAYGRVALAAERMRGCPDANLLDVNVAHCENLFVGGCSFDGRIGVDVEIMRPDFDFSVVGDGFLSAAGRKWIGALPEGQRRTAFYRCWTAKEAFVKAIGLGLSFGLDHIETVADHPHVIRIARVNGSEQLARYWRLIHRCITLAHVAAVIAVVLSG